MKKFTLFVFAAFALLGLACTPRPSDPAEFITLNKQRELQLLGAWKLVALKTGSAPQPHETKTLTFQNDGKMLMDLWEHQLTFKYEVMPDPDHLRLTWVASTNPNDTPWQEATYALRINGDGLTLDGERYQRVALANGATLTPSLAQNVLATPTAPNPQTVTATPTVSLNSNDFVSARLGEPFTLHLKQTSILTDSPDQFGISLFAIKQDSRCPKGVQCFWSGEVRLEITFQENSVQHPPIYEMTTLPNDAKNKLTIENYTVELVDVQPPREVDKNIAPEDYAVTFRVTRAPQATPTSAPPNGLPTYPLDEPFALRMFQRAEVRDAQLSITLNGVLEESRCPKSVNCAQAGRALMSFMLERNQRIGFFGLSTSPPDGRTRAYFQNYSVELLDVQPYPETPDQNIRTVDYSATIVVRKMPPPTVVKKNEGFVLRVGQSVTLADENATVTFVSVGHDSRCPYNVACAVRGNAPVTVTLIAANGETTTFVLNTDSSQQNTRTPATGLYGMELSALTPYPHADIPGQDIAPQEYEATLVVRKFASPQGIPTKTPIAPNPTTCAGLTQTDAAAILGQDVNAEPAPNVKISVLAGDTSFYKPRGICGYTTVAGAKNDVDPMTSPYVWTPQTALGAVTAERLQGEKTLELARIADIILQSQPDAETTPFLMLETQLAAGDWNSIFETFRKLPNDSAQVHFEEVDSFGDEGLWLWRAAPVNHYAALLVRDKNSFVVMEALVPKAIGQVAAKEALHAAMGKIFQ